MAIFGALNALLGVDNRQWNKGFQEARSEVDKTKKKTEGFFKGLKSQFGEESKFGMAAKFLVGAGSIAAIGVAAREVDSLGTAIDKAATDARLGKISTEDLFLTLGKGLPIIGPLEHGLEGLASAITGLGADIQQAAEESKRINDWADGFVARAKAGKTITESWADELRKLRDEFILLKAPADLVPEVKGMQDRDNKLRDLRKKFLDDANSEKFKLGITSPEEYDTGLASAKRFLADRKKAYVDSVREEQRAQAAFAADYAVNGGPGGPNPHTPQLDALHAAQAGTAQSMAEVQAAQAALDKYKQLQKGREDYQRAADQVLANANQEAANRAQQGISRFFGSITSGWADGEKAVKEWGAAAKKEDQDFHRQRLEETRQLVESLKTPSETFQDELQKWQDLYKEGSLSKQKFGAGLDKSLKDFMGTTEKPISLRVQAEDVFSRRTVGASDPMSPLNDIAVAAKQQVDFLKTIAANTKTPAASGPDLVVVAGGW
jgi:hypothetical protein